MSISEQIKHLRTDAKMTQAQLAEKLDVTRATVTQWESGWSKPRMGKVEQLAKLFGVSIAELIDGPQNNSGFTSVPLFGSIAAGVPIEMIETEDAFEIPTPVHEKYPDAFLLKVVGESMNKILPNGCYALVDPCEDVEANGKPYAVCVNGYDATIKRVEKLENGFRLKPDSTDPTFSEQTFNYNEPNTDQINVIGRVVYHVIPYDWSY